jgi:hypothetical protein
VKKCVNKEQRKDLSSKVQVTLTHGDTTFEWNEQYWIMTWTTAYWS